VILISAHRDTIKNSYRYAYKAGEFKGLLDNAIGVLVCQSLLLEEKNIVSLEKKEQISYFFGTGEEWALSEDFPELSKEHIVIVVDVASGDDYEGIDFSIENISGFTSDEILETKEHLEWEGFKLISKEYDATPESEDESWQWRKLGYKVISFIIPIQNGNTHTGWHVDDCTVSIEVVVKAKEGLKRLINKLL